MRKILSHLKNRWGPVRALIIKGLQVIWSDPRNRLMIIMPPILQLFLFAYTATLEVKNVSMLIYDKDRTEISRALIDKFKNTPTVETVYLVESHQQLTNLVNRQKVYVALTIPSDFSKNIYAGKTAQVQLILDGRKSNAAQIVGNYANQIINAFQYEIAGASISKAPMMINVRHWFNPNLNYQWFIIISLIGMLAMMMTMSITALSLAQEKEMGTFDQVLVTPLSSFEILVGKTIPAILIAIADVTVMISIGRWLFGIPMVESALMLYFCLIVFILSICGIGLFISTICHTQQQAILGVFVFMAPTFLLSGYIAPIENMPVAVQKLAYINPLVYFFNLMKGVFLRGMTEATLIQNIVPLVLIAIVTLWFAGWFFHKRLD